MNIYTAEDRTPYTYHICWSQFNIHYYGVKFSKYCHPSKFWIDYKTSSKKVKLFIVEHGDPDIIEIRKIFSSKESAQKWETTVLKRLDVINKPNWLNQHYNLAIKCDITEELKLKRSQNSSGKNNSMYGRRKELNPNFNKKEYNNGEITKRFYPGTEPHGWVLGHLNSNNQLWYTNGLSEIRLYKHQQIPDNFYPGRTYSSNKNKKYYNNGIIDKCFSYHPGEGWSLGRLHNKGAFKLGHPSHNKRKTGSKSHLFGLKWYHNGIKSIRSKTHPGEGWIEGRCDLTIIKYQEEDL